MKHNLEDLYKVPLYNIQLLNVHKCSQVEVEEWIEENISGLWTCEAYEEPVKGMKGSGTGTAGGTSFGVEIRIISLPITDYYFKDSKDAMYFKLVWA